MNIRIPAERRANWRSRFLEIARQVEGAVERPAVAPSGLRSRARMAGFATLRRARPGAHRLA